MADYCLPPKFANSFLNALKAGSIDPEKLSGMSSGERRKFFESIVGPENAEPVNALFESKLLLKDKQAGLVRWAQKITGISDSRRANIVDKIGKMSEILSPMDEQRFLADLAAQKLGTTVTADEAKAIFELSQKAEAAKATMQKDGWTTENGTAYGRAVMDLRDKVESLKPNGRTFGEKLLDVAAIPKSALTSVLHFSALGVQLWGSLTNARTWEGFGQQFKYFRDEQNYRNLQAYMIGHPDYQLAMTARLGITRLGDKLTLREEAIQSSLLEQANKYLSDKTGVPNLVRASSRAFTGYLNFVRFHSFTDLLTAARLNGEDISINSQVIKDIANHVNNFTGRGSLGALDNSKTVVALNATFFAPRKVAATMQMFNPVNFLSPKISATARMASFKNLAGSLIATGAVLGLAKAVGMEVDTSPDAMIAQDFGKIGIGEGEKIDITGGNAIYLRLLARLASGQMVSSKEKLIELGKGYKPATRASLVQDYVRGKLSPVAGAIVDALYGTDPIGRPFSLTQEAQDKLTPIAMSNFIKLAMNDPQLAATMIPSLSTVVGGSLGAFGAGVEVLPSLNSRDVWGELPDKHVQNDPVDAKLNSLGIFPRNADKKIRGVALSEQQQDEYQQVRGRILKGALSTVLQNPRIEKLPPGVQQKILSETMAKATEYANTKMMMRYPGIATEAAAAKKKALLEGTPAAIERRK